jgi:hypothetical protein
MHRSARLAVLIGVLALVGQALYADTIEEFTLSGDFASQQASVLGSPTGDFIIDATTGVVESVNLSFTDYGADAANLTAGSPYVNYGPEIEIAESWYSTAPGGHQFADIDLLLPVSSLVGYTGGAICSEANPCAAGNSSASYLIGNKEMVDGTLTDPPLPDVTATPEPSSIFLLGTAMVVLAAVLQHFDMRSEPRATPKLEQEP